MKALKPASVRVPMETISSSPPSSPAQSTPRYYSSSPVSSPTPAISALLGEEDTTLGEDISSRYTNLELKIAAQPPARTVYQRILKPFPSVVLAPKQQAATDDEGTAVLATLAKAAAAAAAGAGSTSPTASSATSVQHAGLFLEASLVRSDTGAPVAKCLDGNTMVRFERSAWNGGVLTATFKKLKILSTSQQLQGALLRLQFTLKKYTGSAFATVNIPGRSVLSQPIEVFSHSQYLHKKEKGTTKPSKSTSRRDSNEGQGREKRQKIEHDNVRVSLIAAIKAFKDQGGTKDMLIRCIDACFDDESARRHSAPSSSSASSSSPYSSWELTMEKPSGHPLPSHRAASITADGSGDCHSRRRTTRGQESPVRSSPCLPPLRQELGSVLQATAPPQPIRPKPQGGDDAACRPRPHHHQHHHQPSPLHHRSSPPDDHVPSSAYHRSLPQSYQTYSTPPALPSSNILPSLSSLSLLPPSAPSLPPVGVSSSVHHRALVVEPIVGRSAPPSFHHHAVYPPHALAAYDHAHDYSTTDGVDSKRKREYKQS